MDVKNVDKTEVCNLAVQIIISGFCSKSINNIESKFLSHRCLRQVLLQVSNEQSFIDFCLDSENLTEDLEIIRNFE